MSSKRRRVCVIGAGTAGLCALKNSLQQDLDAVCYEQASGVGGTWVYQDYPTDRENIKDEDVHSSMYEGLRTNLPKEIMGYPDFPYPDSTEESFVTSADVLRFLQIYTENFDLKKFIRFQHEVIRVRPCPDHKWEVYVKDKKNAGLHLEYFDFIFVCNGHYMTPQYPQIKGMQAYKGKQIHSHLYRKASHYADDNVLVIGCGPSGIDIATHLNKTAKHVYLSHHLATPPDTSFLVRVTQKPDILEFTEDGAIFKDNSRESFSTVIYCTGYKYTFPFMSVDCGLCVVDNFVNPLYKHCININYPTMSLIGLPFKVCPTQLFDLQVRFTLKFFTGQKCLPTREAMLKELEDELEVRHKAGLAKRRYHEMGERQFEYYQQLSELANIKNIKPVIGKIMKECGTKYIFSLQNYRDHRFRIVDDENFVKYPTKQIT